MSGSHMVGTKLVEPITPSGPHSGLSCRNSKFKNQNSCINYQNNMWATDVVNDEPGLLPGEVEVELEGHRQGDVVDAANLFFFKKNVYLFYVPN